MCRQTCNMCFDTNWLGERKDICCARNRISNPYFSLYDQWRFQPNITWSNMWRNRLVKECQNQSHRNHICCTAMMSISQLKTRHNNNFCSCLLTLYTAYSHQLQHCSSIGQMPYLTLEQCFVILRSVSVMIQYMLSNWQLPNLVYCTGLDVWKKIKFNKTPFSIWRTIELYIWRTWVGLIYLDP